MLGFRKEDRFANRGVIEGDGEQAGGEERCGDGAEGVEKNIEGEIVEGGGQQGNEAEAEQHEIDAHGVAPGFEVRGLVAVGIDGADGFFDNRDAEVFGGDQHLQFELIAGGGYGEQAEAEGARDGSKAGLGVGDAVADDESHNGPGDGVPDAAAGGDAAGEGSGAEHEGGGITEVAEGDAADVGRVMLAVGVRGDDAEKGRKFDERVVHAGFEGGSLAEVHGVAEQGAIEGVEDGGERGTAAVVDDEDGGEALVG